MVLFMLALGMRLAVHPVTAHCKSGQQMQTDAVRNALGVSVSLKMQSDDDHTKNCMAVQRVRTADRAR